jgi:hypothetical protein
MSYEINLELMTVDALAHRCTEETERFRLRLLDDSRYCFELFRRAICERVELAWDMIYKQYEPEVAIWVKERVGFDSSAATIDHFINGAFAKMWHALTREKFGKFADIKSLLYYLKMCVYSVVVDHNRLTEPPSQDYPDDSPVWGKDPGLPPEEAVVEREKQRAFWDWIDERLHDDKERLVVYGSFDLNLKPKELYARFQNRFDSVAEIYTTKQNILARLQRDPEFRKFLGTDA